ncbi:AAA-like domain-containing protein [Nostoc sp. FACHB-190]|uniref:AAA-like domain-containing protein n=1 Tax=Nostoc sp. FACHB-190 TaxID=2692838 RepID=UPI0016898583|nr:AAA-like domain-containing protein [Nostoc sp. FACHB-190]MBD2302208.1 AAA-like domain-containing protein [Nostoc sp. FACHB-190]
MKKILILSANPTDTGRLRLDEEVREIQAGLERAKSRGQFEIITKWAVRADDLRRALLDHNPEIIHFCGHGGGNQGLALADNTGKAQAVSSEALSTLFSLFEGIECVVLNACYSEVQAEAIRQHTDYVVGMNQAIGDMAAIKFAVGFYDALGAGRSYQDAYKFGCVSIDLENIPESAKPVLKHRDNLINTQQVSQTKRVFISYKRNVDPDEIVALQVCQALAKQHQVFIDQTMLVGTRWAERIEAEIRQADFLITFLSAQSVHSEMVEAEIRMAHNLAQLQGGKPAILPVRLAYREPFQYPLSAYLNHINWAFWQGQEDTPSLITELNQAISGGQLSISAVQTKADILQTNPSPLPHPFPSAQPVTLEMPEGTMDCESKFYVERSSDPLALEAIKRQGVTITIKGPRQMGKSSLLIRTNNAAVAAGKRVAFLDFQLFDKATLNNADKFFRQFCSWLTDELEMADKVDEYWQMPLGNSQRCTRYVGRYLLKDFGQPLVLAMDEVESVFDSEFRSDFFGMLRSWHNSRATTPIWKKLDLALVTSTEPYQLIDNLNQSPFNVGVVIDLEDFTTQQVADLNQRHGSPLNFKEEQQLIALLGGHPYLVRLALYWVASQRLTSNELFANATADNGPFGNHLRNHLFRLHNKTELVQGMLQVIHQNTCEDERVFFRLRGAGLVRREGRVVMPRCQLYGEYFRENLRG